MVRKFPGPRETWLSNPFSDLRIKNNSHTRCLHIAWRAHRDRRLRCTPSTSSTWLATKCGKCASDKGSGQVPRDLSFFETICRRTRAALPSEKLVRSPLGVILEHSPRPLSFRSMRTPIFPPLLQGRPCPSPLLNSVASSEDQIPRHPVLKVLK